MEKQRMNFFLGGPKKKWNTIPKFSFAFLKIISAKEQWLFIPAFLLIERGRKLFGPAVLAVLLWHVCS